MRNFISIMKSHIKYYIIRPIKKLYNRIFNCAVVPNNQRNREWINYCCKIVKDPSYKPQTVYENQLERMFYEHYLEMITDTKADIYQQMVALLPEEIPEEEHKEVIYQLTRPKLAQEFGLIMDEYMWEE